MTAATLNAKGQIAIPAEIRLRYKLTPGTQVEFVDEGGAIRLMVRRNQNIARTIPSEGFGLVKLKDSHTARKLSDFDPAKSFKKAPRFK